MGWNLYCYTRNLQKTAESPETRLSDLYTDFFEDEDILRGIDSDIKAAALQSSFAMAGALLLGVFSIGEFVGYLVRCLVAPAFVWFPDILIGLPDNLIQAIAAVWLVVMSIFVPILVERTIDGF